MMTGTYRGRFAPSPTGPLHFGSLVAAVASYLEARVHDGVWLIRMEDLDPPRTAKGAAEEILRTLEACGMQSDGPIVHQSARSDAYHAALHALRQHEKVYPCACSRREIADSAVAGIEGYVYPGTCREGLPAGRTARAWRVRTDGASIDFNDSIQGGVAQNLEKDIGDFVLYRADRIYAYQVAVVVDDAEQRITDVVRGADLLGSTARQIYLQRLLSLPTPHYVHVPVAVNTAGEKLSKQTLAPAIDRGNIAAALTSALRFLGHAPPAELDRASTRDVWSWAVENWRLARVPRIRSSVLSG